MWDIISTYQLDDFCNRRLWLFHANDLNDLTFGKSFFRMTDNETIEWKFVCIEVLFPNSIFFFNIARDMIWKSNTPTPS